MKNVTRFLLLTAVIAVSGCTLTLNSLFTNKDVIYDPALEGVWKTTDATWTIKPFHKPTGRYVLQATTTDQPLIEFYATLGTVGTNRFLELTPQRPHAIHAKSFFGGHFLVLHSFWKVLLRDDRLTLTSMATQWLDSMVKQKKTDIRYEKSGDGLLFLTASTEELREFVNKYADDRGAFPTTGDETGIIFERTKEIPTAQPLPLTNTVPWTQEWGKPEPSNKK